MKEKRIDIYLAKAGFWQILVVAFGSTSLTEFLAENFTRSILSSIAFLISAVYAQSWYDKAEHLLVKQKKKNHAVN